MASEQVQLSDPTIKTLMITGLSLLAIQFPLIWFSPLAAACSLIILQSIGFVKEAFKEWQQHLPFGRMETSRRKIADVVTVYPVKAHKNGESF